LHVLDRGAQVGAQTVACGDVTLPHQEKNTWQMSRGTEKIYPRAQRQRSPRGDVPLSRLSRLPLFRSHYVIVVPKPVLRAVHVATRRCISRK
jgi:hypothetical protein